MERLTQKYLERLPTGVRVGPSYYRIELFDELIADEIELKGERKSRHAVEEPLTSENMAGVGDHLYGIVNHNAREIKLSRSQGEQSFRDSLMHEILHAVEYMLALEIREEDTWRLAPTLLDLFDRNPWLMEFLLRRSCK